MTVTAIQRDTATDGSHPVTHLVMCDDQADSLSGSACAYSDRLVIDVSYSGAHVCASIAACPRLIAAGLLIRSLIPNSLRSVSTRGSLVTDFGR